MILWGSDHLLIPLHLNHRLDLCNFIPHLSDKQWLSANFERKTKRVTDTTDYLETQNDPILQYITLFSEVLSLLEPYTPRRTTTSNLASSRSLKGCPAPWWTEECTETMHNRKKSTTKRYRSSPTLSNYTAYQQESISCKRIFKKVKREGWRAFCGQLSKLTKWHQKTT